MAVLYRTNSQSRALEEAFRRAGVPYRLIGAISFYERREVKDLLAYLRLVANPRDDEAFLRAVAVPRRGLGETSLAALGQPAQQWGKPLLATAAMADRIPDLRPNVREAFRSFAGFIDGAGGARRPAPAGRGAGADHPGHRLRGGAAGGGPGRRRPLGERPRAGGERRGLVGGGDRGSRAGTPLERFLAEAALLVRGRHGRGSGCWA